MSDVLLEHTGDGGDVRIVGAVLAIDEGLSTAVYISLFGGNSADNGTDATAPVQWWGNRIKSEPARKYRSEMQAIIASSALTSGSILRIEQAGARDLAWMVEAELAEAIAVQCSIPGVDKLAISIRIETGQRVIVLGYEVTRGS
jgi:phage gp46-like protein